MTAFSFFNELDLLEIRLHELNDVVDKFVIVEANKTHSGLEKPLWYLRYRSRYQDFWKKIIHIVVDDMPMSPDEIQAAISPQDRKWLDTGYQLGDNWVRERYQRNAIMRGLIDCSPDDIIIIEDADEMVRPEILANIRETIVDGSNAVEQEFRTCYANWLCTNMPWWGS